jgi:DNA-binding FadR family transcriptional regulator
MNGQREESEILEYIVSNHLEPGDRLPSLSELSQQLGVSVGKLREDLEVARHMGVVSVRPRLGIRRETFDFYPVVQSSLRFGLHSGEASFRQYSQLRKSIEANMWHEAVANLGMHDKEHLERIIDQAWGKLRGSRVLIPNGEHRELHLAIFKRLENPFVDGLLRAYWDAYFDTELSQYAEYEYWIEVWTYHQRIVEALCEDRFEEGRQLLIEHFDLLPSTTYNA